MGSLTLPASGSVYFDANVMIYSVEKVEPYERLLLHAWKASEGKRIEIISSELIMLECLVKPIRDADTELQDIYHELLLESDEVRLIPMSVAILERAARIRAETGLKTPDAIHATTAQDVSTAQFITNDAAFRRVPGLAVTVLKELIDPG